MSSLCVVSNKGGTERRSGGANRERDVSKYDSVIGEPLRMRGAEVSPEKSRRRRRTQHKQPSRWCVRRNRAARKLRLPVCSSFVSNKQNKEATERFNRHIERCNPQVSVSANVLLFLFDAFASRWTWKKTHQITPINMSRFLKRCIQCPQRVCAVLGVL